MIKDKYPIVTLLLVLLMFVALGKAVKQAGDNVIKERTVKNISTCK